MLRVLQFFRWAKTNPSEADLLRANENLKSYIAELSHEINHRVDHVRGFLHFAIQDIAGGQPLEEIKAGLETAMEAAHFLVAILDNVLDLSQIEAGKPTPREHDVIYIRPFFEEFVNSYVKAFAKASIKIDLSFGPDIPDMIVSDKSQLLQIIFNLVGNAVKFSAPNEPIKIEVRRMRIDLWVFAVKNIGQGIPIESFERIFEPYFSLRSQEKKGTGLGLFIVKKKVKLLDGKIRVESHEGGMTIFTVSLPIKTIRNKEI